MRLIHFVRSAVPIVLASSLGSSVLVSCTGPRDGESYAADRTASVAVALVSAPNDALCLEIATTPTASPLGEESQLFTLTPGTSSTVTMSGLLAGEIAITARAFSISCGQVQSSTAPTWVSAAPVTLTLVAAQTVPANIVLRRPSNVQITATFDDSAFAVTPTSLSFGSLSLGNSASLSLTVTNSSAVSVTLPTATISGTDASQFALGTSTCSSTLAASVSCVINIVFLPTSIGAKTATVTLGSASVSLTGVGNPGTPTPALTLTPNPLNFGSFSLGSSASLPLTVTNSSAISATLSTATISGTDASQFAVGTSTCSSTLAASASCVINIVFLPTSIGAKTATVTLGSASGSLTGVGNPGTPTPALTLNPNPLSFGSFSLGSSASLPLTVTNSSAISATLSTATISGTDASQFALGTTTCSSTLAASASCVINIIFLPTSIGAKTATVTLGSASGSLTGVGNPGTPTPALTLNPNPLSFGSFSLGSSASLPLTVTNSSAASVTLPTATISGTDVSQFALGTSTCSSTLAASASCVINIVFLPTSIGAKTATVTLGSASGSLTGVGNPGTPTPVYQINCGSSSTISPFAADQYVSGGTQRTVTNTIATSGITNVAPQGVYQSERYGNSTYTFPNLTASAKYTVRLHFAELYQTASGKRVFNVSINGNTVLSNFDIYAAAGAAYQAVVREFTTTGNSSGQIIIQFATVTDNATIEGIEIIK
jgi:hypothetical protein